MVMLFYGKKEDTLDIKIFAPYSFTIEDVSLTEKLNHETKTKWLQLTKVIFIEREDFVFFKKIILRFNKNVVSQFSSSVHLA